MSPSWPSMSRAPGWRRAGRASRVGHEASGEGHPRSGHRPDIVVVSLHGGVEYLPSPDPRMAEIADRPSHGEQTWCGGTVPRRLSGASLGSGDRTAVVAESLGNFLFDQRGTMTGRAVLEVMVDRHGVIAYRIGQRPITTCGRTSRDGTFRSATRRASTASGGRSSTREEPASSTEGDRFPGEMSLRLRSGASRHLVETRWSSHSANPLSRMRSATAFPAPMDRSRRPNTSPRHLHAQDLTACGWPRWCPADRGCRHVRRFGRHGVHDAGRPGTVHRRCRVAAPGTGGLSELPGSGRPRAPMPTAMGGPIRCLRALTGEPRSRCMPPGVPGGIRWREWPWTGPHGT